MSYEQQEYFTRFPNKLMDNIIKYMFTPTELNIILVIARLTYGYHKISDSIPISKIVGMTGYDKKNISDAVKDLINKKVINLYSQNTEREARVIGININFTEWAVKKRKGCVSSGIDESRYITNSEGVNHSDESRYITNPEVVNQSGEGRYITNPVNKNNYKERSDTYKESTTEQHKKGRTAIAAPPNQKRKTVPSDLQDYYTGAVPSASIENYANETVPSVSETKTVPGAVPSATEAKITPGAVPSAPIAKTTPRAVPSVPDKNTSSEAVPSALEDIKNYYALLTSNECSSKDLINIQSVAGKYPVSKIKSAMKKSFDEFKPSAESPKIKSFGYFLPGIRDHVSGLGKYTSTAGRSNIDFEKLKDTFNTMCPSLDSLKVMTENRKYEVTSLLSKISKKDLITVFEKTEKSDFLTGRTGKATWKADFNWIIQYDHAIKILEGSHDNLSNGKQKKAGRNSFVNYKQRTWDFERLKELEYEYIERDLASDPPVINERYIKIFESAGEKSN